MIDFERFDAILGEAGRIAMAAYPGAGNTTESWWKADDSPVSAADLAVNGFLKTRLHALLPSAGWLSEETADGPERVGDGFIWLVDPIDGTRDFLRGRDGWAISVALISAGRPLLARLIAPARGEIWAAHAGRGAFRNGQRLRASTRTALDGARIPMDGEREPSGVLAGVAKPNSIALRIAMVAADEADLAMSIRRGYEWDIGAAALIAREAGAIVTDAQGGQLTYNKRDPHAHGVLASAPAIHDEALAWLKKADKR